MSYSSRRHSNMTAKSKFNRICCRPRNFCVSYSFPREQQQCTHQHQTHSQSYFPQYFSQQLPYVFRNCYNFLFITSSFLFLLFCTHYFCCYCSNSLQLLLLYSFTSVYVAGVLWQCNSASRAQHNHIVAYIVVVVIAAVVVTTKYGACLPANNLRYRVPTK